MAFALSLNMMTRNQDVIISTTLAIVFLTTLPCGAMVEPLVIKLKLQNTPENSSPRRSSLLPIPIPQNLFPTNSLNPQDSNQPNHPPRRFEALRRKVKKYEGFHKFWNWFDIKYMQPMFGGSKANNNELIQRDSDRHPPHHIAGGSNHGLHHSLNNDINNDDNPNNNNNNNDNNNDNVDDIVVIDDEEYEDDELRVELPDRFWAKTTPHVLHDTISSDHFINEQTVENIINPITQVNDDLYLNPNGINDNPNQDIEMNITNRNESSEKFKK